MRIRWDESVHTDRAVASERTGRATGCRGLADGSRILASRTARNSDRRVGTVVALRTTSLDVNKRGCNAMLGIGFKHSATHVGRGAGWAVVFLSAGQALCGEYRACSGIIRPRWARDGERSVGTVVTRGAQRLQKCIAAMSTLAMQVQDPNSHTARGHAHTHACAHTNKHTHIYRLTVLVTLPWPQYMPLPPEEHARHAEEEMEPVAGLYVPTGHAVCKHIR